MKDIKSIARLITEDPDISTPLVESGFARLLTTLRGIVPSIKTLAFITAHNPRNQPSSPAQNNRKNEALKRDLKQMNLGYKDGKGKYGGPEEDTLFIPNIRKDEAIKLGNKYNQESVIWGEKVDLEDHDGFRFYMIYTIDSDAFSIGDIAGVRDIFLFLSNDEDCDACAGSGEEDGEVCEKCKGKGKSKREDFYSEIKGRKFRIPYFDDEYEGATFKPGEGAISKKGLSAESIRKLEARSRYILESSSGKSRWINRGVMKDALKFLYKSRS